MNLRTLTAVFTVYLNNIKILNWGLNSKLLSEKTSTGELKDYKSIMEFYHDQIDCFLDKVAVLTIENGQTPPTVFESTDIVKNYQNITFIVFDRFTSFNVNNCINMIDVMFKDIICCIDTVLELDDSLIDSVKRELIKLSDSMKSYHKCIHNLYKVKRPPLSI